MEVPLTTTDTTNWSIQQIGCNVCKPKQDQDRSQDRRQDRGYYDNEKNQLQPNKQNMGNNLLWIILALIILLFIGSLLMRKSGNKSINKKSRR
jgi:hypothetical protein